MMILSLSTSVFLLATSSGQLSSVPSNKRNQNNIQKEEEKQRLPLLFKEEDSDGIDNLVERKLSPPKGYGVFATRTIP
eukprot:CAMPEP_0170966742 /NCGR_PEP_ID=MMETSP0735-20130129/42019_1 /TAXON_ID=186038 /ORGANISM="Fragilariopsis kerguelensis, Strain L26-C5" /LENGTH=77 /DNA_ID=CAMNT_0011384989 /DNA_START=1 /DNA_END=230 /DNA_ORIENTATION=-